MYSPCATWTFKQLIREAEIKELDGLIITDHDSLSPVSIDSFGSVKIFVGMEISSQDGHVLAYGISEEVPPLSVEEVIERIHEQGGIAVAAHPYRNFKQEGLQSSACSVKDKMFELKFDGVEIRNGLNSTSENERSKQAARLLNLPPLGGSDAHSKGQLGRALTITRYEINSLDDFIVMVKKHEVQARVGSYG